MSLFDDVATVLPRVILHASLFSGAAIGVGAILGRRGPWARASAAWLRWPCFRRS